MSPHEHDQLQTLAAISAWLEALGALCAGNFSTEAARAKVDAYAPMLALRYRASTLDARLLEYVAAKCKFWPSYSELVGIIEGCPFFYRPVRPELAAPVATPKVEMSQEEKAIMAAKLRQLAKDIASGFSSNNFGQARHNMTLKRSAREELHKAHGTAE